MAAVLDEQRILGEFDSCPGLRLTSRQTARLTGLDQETVADVLADLVGRGLLVNTGAGGFGRTCDCDSCCARTP